MQMTELEFMCVKCFS